MDNKAIFKKIPAELRQLPQWVTWKLEERNGKKTKIPYDPKTGKRAKANDPDSWSSFEKAVAESARYSGIGFMFSDKDPYCGIDVDGRIDEKLVEHFDSYAERSQSGHGCHIIGEASLPEGKGRRNGWYEIYDRKRFFVMTGDVISDSPIRDCQKKLDRFVSEYIDADARSEPSRPQSFAPADCDIVERIRQSRQGPKFERLWNGHWQGEYKSQSEADMALLGMLADWTNADKAESFRLFGQSELGERAKWCKREDYRDATWARVQDGKATVTSSTAGPSKLKPLPEKETNTDVRKLGDFVNPGQDDPNQLLLHRFLCRTCGGLLIGPSGIGKSSFVIQAAILWSLGRGFFDIHPASKLNILIVQAENDDGDMAEMRDGVLEALRKEKVLDEEEVREVMDRVLVCREAGSTGTHFCDRLRKLLEDHPGVDLVFIDPAFAYLGGDVLQAKDVSLFLRENLNPILLEYSIGAMIVHHSNKPPKGKDRNGWIAGDFAYLGAGSAEWTNWARCVLAIRNRGSDRIFEFRAAKRGKRLDWTDEKGKWTGIRHIKHSDEGICWVPPDPREVYEEIHKPDMKGKKSAFSLKHEVEVAVEAALEKVWDLCDYLDHLKTEQALSEGNARKVLKKVEQNRRIARRRANDKRGARYLIGPDDAVKAEVARISKKRETD